ncbi:Stk1 family PASTA domain-containing Ser/Thr kinase [Streptomyces radicis]|uniref:non-specific serine/threonine protein kinase n=1 Tax=Streptomyces radicis TaxID=1750517 RepID=A0A3A9W208_9ACTN|nr:Stk1 family PASTA domain-containing Ser/Thr kinase [Streptomyces radicis]RKN07265.1 Stk1 family PASTA domain-containing Ser/Thr kinase [Streptomyces radicis]RKN26718.1 Stk1 family PASTA domain-containing Ser/Thr kinase [Streptomyces radicis]
MDEPRRLGGRYELGQVLGRGGMAEVYLAHDTRLGRTVAVKTLRADLARDPTFQARFRREAQSAASLNHPAIVAVYDTGEDYVDGISIPYIVMEYVDGSTLRELLHSGRKLLPERALEMCIGILQALEYSHRNGIVHRDIKPANVMLTRTGQVKVMDFGIARAMGDSGMTMTQTAAVIGTAQYLSPEQAKGETVDARSDLYSTGCLLYELLTVRPPFIGDSPVAVAYQHVREEPQSPSVFDPEITPDTDAIVLKALVKDPDYRYQSADEMRADIEATLDGRPVGAMAAMGAAAYGYDDRPTTALRPTDPATTMLPPASDPDGYDDYPSRADRRQRNRNTSTILLVLAGVLVLVGAIFIGRALFASDPPAGELTVPDVAGETLEEAQDSLVNAGFQPVESGETAPCEQEADTVCRTDPPAGEEHPRDTEVSIIMSEGPEPVEVPDVVGDPFDEAEAELEEAGFEVEREEEVTADETPETVLDQSPGAGEEADPESVVTLTVAVEPDGVQVPDVIGDHIDQARAELEAADFIVVTQNQTDDSRDEGEVISQDPTAGSTQAPGTTVTLTVAIRSETQPPPVTLPNDMVNRPLAEIRPQLQGMGLNVVVNGPDTVTAIVTATDPPPGSQVQPQSTVTLTTQELGGGPGGPGGGDQGGDNGGPLGFREDD